MDGTLDGCSLFSVYEEGREYPGLCDDRGFMKDPRKYANIPSIYGTKDVGLYLGQTSLDVWLTRRQEMKLNRAEEAVKDYADYYDTQEPQSAPSGEWEEYNVHYLMDGAYLDGMEYIREIVGTCEKCQFQLTTGRGENHRDCRVGNGIHPKNWYCADFEPLEKSDENV